MTLADHMARPEIQKGDDFPEGLIARLPPSRGKILPNEPLAHQTWFRVGGPAEALFKPADEDDLAQFLAGCPLDVPVTVIGLASNLLVRDGGVPGVVIRLGPAFASLKADGTLLTAGAGAIDLNVARAAQGAGIGGLAFLSGIPGTIGGGLRMNGGAYGGAFEDIVVSANVIDRDGSRRTLGRDQIGFSYRHTDVSITTIFVSAILEGTSDDPAAIAAKMQDIQQRRLETQPIREKTGGSTFANPGHDPLQRKSWRLIDEAGCRGLKKGGAMVSEQHCNFLINTGAATAAEIEDLGEEVRKRVVEKFGIELRWEIKRIGLTREERRLSWT